MGFTATLLIQKLSQRVVKTLLKTTGNSIYKARAGNEDLLALSSMTGRFNF